MDEVTVGDRVRIDIPDKRDPDHDQYHGEHGTVVTVLDDDGGRVTQDKRDNRILRINLDSGETADFRWRDVRPPLE